MKINFTQTVTNIDGAEIKDGPTLKELSIQALVTPLDGDQQSLSPQKKFELGLLAEKIALGGDVVDVTAEEIATLKDRIGKGFAQTVVLFAWRAFEAAASAPEASSGSAPKAGKVGKA